MTTRVLGSRCGLRRSIRKYSRHLSKDQLVIVEGELTNNDYGEGLSVKAEKILDIDEARSLYGRGLFLDLSAGTIPEDFNEKLKVLLSPHRQTNLGSRVILDMA